MTGVANRNILGPLLIIIGLLFLFTSLDFLGVWKVLARIWPLVLIAIGVLVITGHIPLSRWSGKRGAAGRFEGGAVGLFGDIRLSDWDDDGSDINKSLAIGDIVIDLTKATLIDGDNEIDVSVMIGDITVIAPPQMPIAGDLRCYVGALATRGRSAEGIIQQLKFQSDGYEGASARVSLKGRTYVGNIQVRESADRRSSDGQV